MDGENSQHSSDTSGGWQFKPEGQGASQENQPVQQPSLDNYQPQMAAEQPMAHDDVVTWSASEFIAHQKSFVWYALLGLVAIAVGALIYILTSDKISTGAVIFVAVVMGIAAARKPRTLPYQLDHAGLSIGVKFYDYGQFRSFAVMDEGAFSSVVFMPLRRFMPIITVYFEPQDQDRIVAILADHLPMEAHQLDTIDQLMRKIRF